MVHKSTLTFRFRFSLMIVIGMFLWVRLVVDSLLECHSISELRVAVTQLPNGLNAA